MIFEAFPKIPRLRRECTITEKIDGTNAGILIAPAAESDVPAAPIVLPAFPALGGREVLYRIDPAIQERIYL